MKKVLVAEDNMPDQELIRITFASIDPNFEVICVSNGEELLRHLGSSSPYELCFVMLDLNMPRMGGIDVLERLAGDNRYRTVPVIVFSSSVQVSEVQRCYTLGANAYVRKPEDLGQYHKTLTAITEFWGGTNVLAKPVAYEF